eukprot:8405335-Pyramimonas_sp.AAC.1
MLKTTCTQLRTHHRRRLALQAPVNGALSPLYNMARALLGRSPHGSKFGSREREATLRNNVTRWCGEGAEGTRGKGTGVTRSDCLFPSESDV